MKLKRFRAADMRSAMQMIRETFGPDAVIMSNQTLENGVEIVAAIDVDDTFTQPTTTTSPQHKKPIQWHHDGEYHELKTEIMGLKELLSEYLSGTRWEQFQQAHPMHAILKRKLTNLDISAQVQEELCRQIQEQTGIDSAWQSMQTLLINAIKVDEQDMLQTGGPIAIFGPTGVGKTTTLAKLAARYVLRFGNQSIAMISTDTYRIGAFEQLSTYGKLLDVPVYVAETRQELQERLQMLSDKRCVLIDTAGVSQSDPRTQQQLQMISEVYPKVTGCLLLPCNRDYRNINDIIKQYSHNMIRSCILSKLDESSSLGGLISRLIETQFPISYVTNGQRVPEDISNCNPQQLVRKALELSPKDEDNSQERSKDPEGVAHATE